MRRPYRLLLLLAASLSAAGACSSDRDPAARGGEPVSSTKQYLTGKCQTQTFQLPCDPDDTGPLTECQGICSHDADGKMQCVPIADLAIANLDGRLCGDDESCSSICSGTACVQRQAPDGM